MRVRCKADKWKENQKDPELTKGKFYEVKDSHVMVMNAETMYSLVGDSGEQIERPKHIFQTMPEHAEQVRKKAKMSRTLKYGSQVKRHG